MPGSDGFFRASAGAVILDGQGKVLALRRKQTPGHPWQLPQGGIGFDEAPEDAAWREVKEETGLSPSHLELVARSREWLVYELPTEYRSAKVGWGQAQRWFLFRARPGAPVRPDQEEFDAYQWLAPEDLVGRAVAFRVPIYRQVFSEFAAWL
jgi:putative (di)nucleoside polyphosphate hydrolase